MVLVASSVFNAIFVLSGAYAALVMWCAPSLLFVCLLGLLHVLRWSSRVRSRAARVARGAPHKLSCPRSRRAPELVQLSRLAVGLLFRTAAGEG